MGRTESERERGGGVSASSPTSRGFSGAQAGAIALRTGSPRSRDRPTPHTPRAHERRSRRAQAPASGHDSPRGAPAAATGFPRPPSPAPPSPGARTAARRGAFPHLLPLFPSGPQASTCTPAAPPNSKGPPSSSGRHHPARGTQSSFHHRRRGSGRSRDTQGENPRRPLPPSPRENAGSGRHHWRRRDCEAGSGRKAS